MPPVVVVGAGVAGLCAALAAAPRRVVLVSRHPGSVGSASSLAQGGIAAALAAGDSIQAHVVDTMAAGAGHNDAAQVRALARAAPSAIAWLESIGVAFDRDAGGLRLGREGGHSAARIVHAGGDCSGARVMEALLARVGSAAHVDVHAASDADGLLMRDGHVAGVRLHDGDGRSKVIEAGAVVLATGGLGGLFACTTNPAGSTGSGLALAMAAGARMRDLEFVQFHPTALDVRGTTLPLITEALRGAGARLRDDSGRALMDGLHPLGDLAPRDVVARSVWKARLGGQAWLDATGLSTRCLAQFPTVTAICAAHGIQPHYQPIPITPAAHFHMGGIATDGDGRTSLPGLYAVGEVACNGVHGANRLASNSLLEGVVYGHRIGRVLRAQRARSPGSGGFTLLERGPGLNGALLHEARHLLWRAAGPVRSWTTMNRALPMLRDLSAQGWQARVALALLSAAASRRTSVGAHWQEVEQ
jgi:L-aspartate oxidase